MKRTFWILIGILVVGGIIFAVYNLTRPAGTLSDVGEGRGEVRSGRMQLASSAFQNNQNIPAKYTCDGENVGPPLQIDGVPADAKSLALIMDDPDAPAGTWVHWVLWNIRPDIREIAKGVDPPGAMRGMTSFGTPGYGGPCPPSGEHHYIFKLYALDQILNLPDSTDAAALRTAIAGHILDQVELTGLYSRQR